MPRSVYLRRDRRPAPPDMRVAAHIAVLDTPADTHTVAVLVHEPPATRQCPPGPSDAFEAFMVLAGVIAIVVCLCYWVPDWV